MVKVGHVPIWIVSSLSALSCYERECEKRCKKHTIENKLCGARLFSMICTFTLCFYYVSFALYSMSMCLISWSCVMQHVYGDLLYIRHVGIGFRDSTNVNWRPLC